MVGIEEEEKEGRKQERKKGREYATGVQQVTEGRKNNETKKEMLAERREGRIHYR